jgi:protoporphyrinogen oxidase
VDGSQLAGEVARRRIAASSPAALARKLVRAADPTKRTFLYPRRGFGQISEALADAATSAGAEVRLGTAVRGLTPVAGGVWVALDRDAPLEVAQVWSTAPIGVLPRLVAGAPDVVRAAADRLEHRAMVLLYLVVEGERWTSYDAHYFPEPAVSAARVSEPKGYRVDAGDPAGRTVLCAELPCAVGDETWTSAPEALAARLGAELEGAGLPRPQVGEVAVRRVERLYPVYRPGYEDHLATVEAWADTVPGLVTFGRQGLFVADNTHHVLAMGRALAGCLRADGTFDEPAWRRERAGFRRFVVED